MPNWLTGRRAPTPETRASLEDPRVPLSDVAAVRALMQEWHGVDLPMVTADTALSVPAIWCAVNFIAGTIAALPLQLFRRTEAGRETASKDPLYAILHDAPNDELTSFAWRKGFMVNALITGRGCSYIERNKAGRVMNLWPLDPANLTVERLNGRKRYRYRDGAREVVYAANEVIDIPFMLKADGISHVNPVDRLKGAIGLCLSLQDYAAKFFANGGVPPLALTGPLPSPGAASRASSDITKAVRDANAERRNVLIVPSGHTLAPIGVDPDKSQMETARRFQIEEIARVYDIPPVFLQDLTNGTYSNTEQQDLHFVKHTLGQWIKAIEQELNLKLFTARNKTNYVEFNVDGLLRGDFKTRMDGWRTAIFAGINTPNEAREAENWPKHGPEADKLYVQGATVPLGTVLSPTKPAPPANDNDPAEPKDDAA
ncbi:phage portal protein [Hansschlegelia beijingensis]|uniref:HK97 family phage portal protein n=1 Tax=Hansschlegelia beijingensis TaxID=1133344 RepID=A0A7W6CYR5_9HYPH|nr:phage portal protein [Hansschlegelia beijingensis]MBB3972772.1 HK97 family phage portal protein [Hansschlegelia beijingensis]